MLSHTIPLDGRSGTAVRLTGDEALDLFRRGFRFSVFRPGVEECRLSPPIETVVDYEAKTLTIRQDETAR